MKIIWSIDDGVQNDLTVFAPLFQKYNVKDVVFYINSGLIGDDERRSHSRDGKLMLVNEVIELSKMFEIGGHSSNHNMEFGKLPIEKQWREIIIDRETLRLWTKQEISSYCHPRGRYSEKTLELLKKAGYVEARTTMLGFGAIDNNSYRKRCFQLAQRKEYKGKPWLDYIKGKYDEGIKNGEREMRIFGHWFELKQENGLDKLENLLKYTNA